MSTSRDSAGIASAFVRSPVHFLVLLSPCSDYILGRGGHPDISPVLQRSRIRLLCEDNRSSQVLHSLLRHHPSDHCFPRRAPLYHAFQLDSQSVPTFRGQLPPPSSFGGRFFQTQFSISSSVFLAISQQFCLTL